MNITEAKEANALRLEVYLSYADLAKQAREAGDLKQALYYWEQAKRWRATYRRMSTRIQKAQPDKYFYTYTPQRKRATVVYEPKTLPPVPPRPVPTGYYLG